MQLEARPCSPGCQAGAGPASGWLACQKSAPRRAPPLCRLLSTAPCTITNLRSGAHGQSRGRETGGRSVHRHSAGGLHLGLMAGFPMAGEQALQFSPFQTTCWYLLAALVPCHLFFIFSHQGSRTLVMLPSAASFPNSSRTSGLPSCPAIRACAAIHCCPQAVSVDARRQLQAGQGCACMCLEARFCRSRSSTEPNCRRPFYLPARPPACLTACAQLRLDSYLSAHMWLVA